MSVNENPSAEWEFDERDDLDGDCWNCGGEEWVSHCFEEYACLYPEEGCELCMRPCEFCAAARKAST